MEGRPNVDLSSVSFDEFVVFLFAREAAAEAKNTEAQKQKPWYWNTDITFNPPHVCNYYVRLFRQPEFLLERFSRPQLEEGFWAIQSPNLECSVYRVLEDGDVPLAAREECIRSMFDLFQRLFAVEPLDTSVSMWWDSLCYDWHCGNRRRERGGEDLQLQEVFFHTLARTLSLDSEMCQGAALHGLGHLHHPGTEELIDRYVQLHPALTKEWRDYALAAARFDVM